MAEIEQKNQATIPSGAIVDSEGVGDEEFSPAAIMSAAPGRLVSTTGRHYAITKEALEELREDVCAAERAGTTAPDAALSAAGWRRAGELARWALDFERSHGVPPALPDRMARETRRGPLPSLNAMAAELREVSRALSDEDRETHMLGRREQHARGAPDAAERGGRLFEVNTRHHARQATEDDVKEKIMAGTEQKRTVYLSFHENFVREGIPYTDKATGEQRTFNQVRIPSGTIIDGQDMGGYEFSPLYVNESKFKGAAWRDVPMLADREVWLQKPVLDPEGSPVLDEDGRRQKDTVRVMPQQIKEALTNARRAWAKDHERETRGLSERSVEARSASRAMGECAQIRPIGHDAR